MRRALRGLLCLSAYSLGSVALLCAVSPAVRADVIKTPSQVLRALNDFWGTPTTGHVLTWNGTAWAPATLGAIVEDVGAITTAQLTGSLILVHSDAASTLAPGTVDLPLVSNGPGEEPAYEVLPVAGGGTGATTAATWPGLAGDAAATTSAQATGSLVLANSTGLAAVTPGTVDYALVSNGAGEAPAYEVLAVAGGGTGQTAAASWPGLAGDAAAVTTTQTTGSILLANTTGLAAVTPGTVDLPLVSNGAGNAPAYEVLSVAGGGTGATAAAAWPGLAGDAAATTSAQPTGSLVLANSTGIASVSPGTVDLPLVSNGAGNAPAYEVLAIAGGGTGATAAASWPGLAGDAAAVTTTQATGSVVLANSAGIATVAPSATVGQPLVSQGAGLPPAYGSVVASALPGLAADAAAVTTAQPTGSLVLANSAGMASVSPGTVDYAFVSNGAGEAPAYEVLAVAGGGTGQTAAASWPGLAGDAAAVTSTQVTGSVLLANTTGLAAVTPGTVDYALVSNGAGNAPAYEVLAVAGGGTSATTAGAARTALGVAIGTDVQAYSATLADLATVTTLTNGGLLAGTTTSMIPLAIGSNAQVLTVDTSLAGRLKWATPAAGGFTVGLEPRASDAPISTTTAALVGRFANSGAYYLSFSESGTAQDSALWTRRLPFAYASGTALTVEFEVSAADVSQATSWGLQIGTLTGADLDTTAYGTILDTAIVGNVTTSATQGVTTTLTYTVATGDMDAAAAGDEIFVLLYRRAPQDASAVTAYVTAGSLSQ